MKQLLILIVIRKNKYKQVSKISVVSKTIVSIAHRLSTVQDANEIVYIEYGKIKEKGSFNELIELKGAFYNLWIRQKSGS